jgi:hyaluronan synthase
MSTSGPQIETVRSHQKITHGGRIHVGRKGWTMRILTLSCLAVIVGYSIHVGIEMGQPLVVFASILPMHSFLILFVGWVFYKNPANRGKVDGTLVSVIVPVFNQRNMIGLVLNAICNSSYKNIEVVAVNDGSTDGTEAELEKISKLNPKIKIINKKNEGKRKAIADGFAVCKGEYFVLIDSDSIVDKYAIEEFVKAFASDKKIGALVGHAKVWNSEKNMLTKLQDVWYDYFFNIRKTTESVFNSVLCCSGCLAAYRKDALAKFIPYWSQSPIHYGDDRELTTYALAPAWAKDQIANLYVNNGKGLSSLSKKAMLAMSQYDDAEDRSLTAQALISWKSVYVASAMVYTDVPEKMRIFVKQQKRWKKGTARVNFFVSTFFWRRHPLMSTLFYLDFMSIFSTPIILVTLFSYVPIMLDNLTLPLLYLLGIVLPGLAHGSDYKFRDQKSRNWMLKPAMDILTTFFTSWLIFPAMWSFRKNEWLTR